MKARFQLFHTEYGESVCLIEMDVDLIKPEADIVDPNTCTLRPLKGGGVFTLIPLEADHQVVCLRRVHKAYQKAVTEPAGVPSAVFSRMDALFNAVGLMFDKVEYVLVENKEDLQNLVTPPEDEDYEPKKVKYNILGDMLDQILNKEKEEEAEAEDQEKLVLELDGGE
jgi:hypothetical protein